MPNIKKIKIGTTTYDVSMDLVSNIESPSSTEAPSTAGVITYVASEIAKLPSPMVFKGTLGTGGTITSLPSPSSSLVGNTYKVITAGTYASQAAKVGDLFICDDTPAWVWVPSGDEPSGTVTNVATGTGLTGGPITSSGTISVDLTGGSVGTAIDNYQFIQAVSLDSSGNLTGKVTPFVTEITSSTTAPTAAAVKAYVDANGVEYIADNRSAGGAALTGVTTRTQLYDGMQICYVLDYAAGSNATLNLTLPSGSTTGAIPIYVRGTTRLGTQYPAGSNLQMVYMQHYKVSGADQGAAWLCVGYYDTDTNYYAACWCGTAASTRAKVGTCYTFALKADSYLFVNMRYANTYKSSTLTFNVNSTGAKTVYINGTISGSSNYTLPAGGYIAYYDGTYWHFRTDGKLPGPGPVYDTSITASSTNSTAPSSLAVKNYVDAQAGGGGTSIDVRIGDNQGGILVLYDYIPTSGKISYVCVIPKFDYIISGATAGYGFWIGYGEDDMNWEGCSAVKWCKNGTWVTCYNSDYYSRGENPVGIYRAGNAIWVKVDHTNTSSNPVAYLLTLPEPYGGSTAH